MHKKMTHKCKQVKLDPSSPIAQLEVQLLHGLGAISCFREVGVLLFLERDEFTSHAGLQTSSKSEDPFSCHNLAAFIYVHSGGGMHRPFFFSSFSWSYSNFTKGGPKR